jgi:autotransporter-associated beta strand protein
MSDAGDTIIGITITNPGTGYTVAPTVTLIGGDGGTTTLTASTLANLATGGLTKQGLGILTLTGNLTYGGTTDIQAGTLQINTPASAEAITLAAITGASTATLGVGDGINATSLTASSVAVGTLTIGAGSTLTIDAIGGGGTSGSALSPVPEPSTITLLALAGLGLLIGALRKRRS